MASETARQGMVQNAQALRFVAAALILMSHLQHEAVDHGLIAAEWNPIIWGVGVDIFFVISGFVMFYTSADAFGRAGASKLFLIRRLIRIVPIYWLFTTLTIVAGLAGMMNQKAFSIPHVVASYLFLPWPRLSDGMLNPVLGLGWTLNYEMFFYVLFAAALLLPKRIGIAALVGAFVLLAALHAVIPEQAFMPFYWSRPIILEFLMGMGVAALYRRGLRIPVWLAVPVALAMLFIPTPDDDLRFLTWGLPAAVIVACAVLLPEIPKGRLHAFLGLLGGASYALYLSHPFTVNVVGVLMKKLGLGVPLLFMVAGAVASIVASILVHLVIELPSGRWLKARLIRRPPAADPAVKPVGGGVETA